MLNTLNTIKGQELIAKVEEMKQAGNNASQIARACGYVSIRDNGNEKFHFTDFYTELLKAEGVELTEREEEEEENEMISNLIEQGYPEDAIQVFIDSFGEDYLEYFSESYQGEYRNGAEFAEEYLDNFNCNIPIFVSIDWEDTWENLSDDYAIKDGYVFYRHF